MKHESSISSSRGNALVSLLAAVESAALADSDKTEVGDVVLAIGNSFGISR